MKNRLFQAAGRRAETIAQANAKLWNAFLIRNNLKECEIILDCCEEISVKSL